MSALAGQRQEASISFAFSLSGVSHHQAFKMGRRCSDIGSEVGSGSSFWDWYLLIISSMCPVGLGGGVGCFGEAGGCGLFCFGDLSSLVRTLSTRRSVALLNFSPLSFLCFLDFLCLEPVLDVYLGGEGGGVGV